MRYELYYTSAPRGLKPGSSGFCTVAHTEGMPAALVARLEGLSSYRPPFAPGSAQAAAADPVARAHWRIPVGGRTHSVLSRIAPAGLDHTRRPNVLAHHVVLDPGHQADGGGPAWLISRADVLQSEWSGEPRLLPPPPPPPPPAQREAAASGGGGFPDAAGVGPAAECPTWVAVAGDAGWAGVLAEAFLLDPERPAYLTCGARSDPLPLLHEAARLLPPRTRWRLTFSTYFTGLPAGLACAWRCVVAGTPAAADAARQVGRHGGLMIDLSDPSRPPPRAPDTPAAEAARTGRPVGPAPGGSTPPGR